MSTNRKIWQLSTGREDMQFILDVLKNPLPRTFKYEKGRANMKTQPKDGDQVYVTCQAQLMCKGYIHEEFHVAEYPPGNPNYGRSGIFATVLVTENILSRPYMKGQRRNWTQVKSKPF